MSEIIEKIILIMVALTVAGYMFGPAIQGWVTANTTGATNVTWLNTTVMPLIVGVLVLIFAIYSIKKK